MSEEQDQGGSKIIKVNTNVTSPVALVLVMLVEFIMFAFYPFIFFVIIPANDYIEYPEFVYSYNDGEKQVVLTKNILFSSYAKWETNEIFEGNGKLRVPKGSVIEVAQVEMKDYPEKAPYISIAFYYDEDGRGYTLWGGIEMDWIDKPGDNGQYLFRMIDTDKWYYSSENLVLEDGWTLEIKQESKHVYVIEVADKDGTLKASYEVFAARL